MTRHAPHQNPCSTHRDERASKRTNKQNNVRFITLTVLSEENSVFFFSFFFLGGGRAFVFGRTHVCGLKQERFLDHEQKKITTCVLRRDPSSYYGQLNFIRDNFLRGKEEKVGQFKSLLSFTLFFHFFFFFFPLGPSSFEPLVAPLLVPLSSRYRVDETSLTTLWHVVRKTWFVLELPCLFLFFFIGNKKIH